MRPLIYQNKNFQWKIICLLQIRYCNFWCALWYVRSWFMASKILKLMVLHMYNWSLINMNRHRKTQKQKSYCHLCLKWVSVVYSNRRWRFIIVVKYVDRHSKHTYRECCCCRIGGTIVVVWLSGNENAFFFNQLRKTF